MYSKSYKGYITGLLLVIYIVCQTDRAIFGFLMEPIKQELGLSDSQLGFLAGPALVLLYALLGIPVARLADRSSRVNIISIAVAFWSVIVTLSATVATFWQFALVRLGVGVGEAGFSAVAQSLINDYHTAKERTRALSIFMLALPLGAVVSSLLAGWINQAYGWRAVFFVAGVPGIALALLVKLTVKEPARQHAPASPATKLQLPPLRAVLSTLWESRSLRHLAIAQGLVNVVACFMGWLPVFFMRNHHMASGELGTWMAVVNGVGGVLGVWLGSYLTERLGTQGQQGKVRLMALATVLITPTAVAALWSPSPYVALAILLPFKFLLFFCYGPTFAFVQALAPANMRATMASVFILIQTFFGGVVGIQLLGILSDVLTPVLGSSGLALRWGLTAISVLALWAGVHFWLAGRCIQRDMQVDSAASLKPAQSIA